MSSIQDKLRHFNEVILKDAASERDRILEQLKSHTEERITLEKRKFQEQAVQFLKKESALAENEKNNIISRAIIESRQLLVKTREDIIKTVIEDAKIMLDEFVHKVEYSTYLFLQIVHSCSLAGEGMLTVYLSKKDMERFLYLLENIKKELPPDTTFEQTDDEIIGGCRVFNKTLGIIIDNTLIGKLESNRDSILEICNLQID